MIFEWDEVKNAINVRKHGIAFEDAKSIFDGPVMTDVDDRADYGEVREISIGLMHNVAVIVVVHTDRQGNRRLISARRASLRERRRYESAI